MRYQRSEGDFILWVLLGFVLGCVTAVVFCAVGF